MRKFALTVLMLVLLPAAAFSQVSLGTGGGDNKGPATARTDKEKKIDEATEKAYEDAVKKERELHPTAKHDPWANVRSSGGDDAKH